jgi:hypothetical protein
VEALGKPFETPCRYERRGGGCQIYAQRPHECAAYQCSWLTGRFEDGDRPDQSRVLFETMQLDNGERHVQVELGLLIDGTAEHAERFARYAELGTIVAVAGRDDDQHRIFGHPRDVQAWLQFLADAQRHGYNPLDDPDHRCGIAVRPATPRPQRQPR